MSRCPECEKNARAVARAERESGVRAGAPDRNGRIVHFSEEERRRRSELAKKLHAEGRFGGAVVGRRGGQAATRHRIFDTVLDHFRQPDQVEMVIKAIESNLKGKNKMARLSAVRELRTAEEKQEERMRFNRGGASDPSDMTQEELEEFVMQGLEAMIDRGELPADVVLGDEDVKDVTGVARDPQDDS